MDTESSNVPQTCKCESIIFGLLALVDNDDCTIDVVDADDIIIAAAVGTVAVFVSDDAILQKQ